MKPPISEWGLRSANKVFLIVGAPGTGKTVMAYRIADSIRGDRFVYVPMSQRYGRPSYYKPVSGKYADDAVILHNDASLRYHARKFMREQNITLDQIQHVRRHRNTDFVWDVQNSGSLDVDVIRAADVLILKQPSVLQGDLERPALRKRYEDANEAGHSWSLRSAYVFTHRKRFTVSHVSLPSYWNEDISRDDLLRPSTPLQKLKTSFPRLWEPSWWEK